MASVISDLGGSLKQRLGYLEQAVWQAPDWISPRQYLAQTLIELNEIDRAYAEVIIGLSFVKTQKNIPLSNLVEVYYESAVTGRTWPDAEKDLIQLLHVIEEKQKVMSPETRQQMGKLKAIPFFTMSLAK